MTTMGSWRMLAGVVTLALLGAGCSSGTARSGTALDQSSTTATSTDALAALVADQQLAEAAADPNALQLTPQQARCIADGVVADLGPDRLAALGFDPDTGSMPTQDLVFLLTADERETVVGHVEACVDLVSAAVEMLIEAGLSNDEATCVAQIWVESGLVHESLASPGYDPDLNQRIDDLLTTAVASCAG